LGCLVSAIATQDFEALSTEMFCGPVEVVEVLVDK
jgi:hypothetical protein